MPAITQILASVAAIVVILEFIHVFRIRRDARIWAKLSRQQEQ